MKAFPKVFDGPGVVGGKLNSMKIHLKPGPKNVTHLYTPRKCPYAFKGQALGIIEKVEGTSKWCSPMSFVMKPNGGC